MVKNNILHYFENKRNYFDIAAPLIFTIGMSLRFLSLNSNENVFISARLILCIDLIVWFIRLLHMLVVFKSLGPKVVMIQKMVHFGSFVLLLTKSTI